MMPGLAGIGGILSGLALSSGGAPSAPGSHRYWRIRSTVAQQWLGMNTVEGRETRDGSNAFTGGTASASSQFSGTFSADKAVDGNGSTKWAIAENQGLNAWWKYDLGSGNAKEIVEFAFTIDDATNCFASYALEYSDDNSAWTTWFSATMLIRAANVMFTLPGSWWRVRPTYTMANAMILAELNYAGVTRTTGAGAASSTNGFLSPATAVADGNNSTRWASAEDPTTPATWVAVQTTGGNPSSVTLRAAADSTWGARVPTAFVVEKTDNHGAGWTSYAAVTGQSAWSDGESRTINIP